MKRVIGLILAILLVLSAAVFAGGAKEGTEQKKITLRYGELNPAEHPITKGAYEFARLAKEMSDGRITIDVYPSSQLGNEREQMQSIQQGALDFFRPNTAAMPDFGVKEMALLALPFIFQSRDHMWKVLNGKVGERILRAAEERKTRMVALVFLDDGARHIFTTKTPVRKLGDLRGLKIRVPQNELFIEMIAALGASPTPIAYAELYSALQTGVVDGAENTIAGYASNAFYEPAPNFTLTRHMSPPGVIIASDITWNQKLGAKDRELLTTAVKRASEYVTKETVAFEEKALADLEKKGVNIMKINDVADWQNAVQSLYKKYGAGFEDIIKEIQSVQ